MSSDNIPQSREFLTKAVRDRLLEDGQETDRLRDLSEGLEWLKGVIDNERERQVASKLLTLKLLYAGYFGTKGRSSKYARNPCAIREALHFCRENNIPPPDWTLNYIYELMAGREKPPTEQDEKRWTNLMKLLDLAAEWDKKAQEGLSEAQVDSFLRKRGVGEKAIQYAKAFANPQAKQVVFDFAKTLKSEPLIDLETEAAEADNSEEHETSTARQQTRQERQEEEQEEQEQVAG